MASLNNRKNIGLFLGSKEGHEQLRLKDLTRLEITKQHGTALMIMVTR